MSLAGPGLAAERSYLGQQVLRTAPLDRAAAALLMELSDLHFWREPMVGRGADIMVTERKAGALRSRLSSLGISVTTMVESVQQLIEENRPAANTSKLADAGYNMEWTVQNCVLF